MNELKKADPKRDGPDVGVKSPGAPSMVAVSGGGTASRPAGTALPAKHADALSGLVKTIAEECVAGQDGEVSYGEIADRVIQHRGAIDAAMAEAVRAVRAGKA